MQVLLVDDEPLIRWSVASTLADEGHAVVEAEDAASAMQALGGATRPFDVVLRDYRLPDSNDLTLLSGIVQRSPSTSVVLMTAFGTPEIMARALQIGACHAINKPFDMREINSVVLAARAHEHTIECGDHVCAMLSNIDELAKLAADWIAEGLGRDERCWYVAAADEAEAVRQALRSKNVDCDVEQRRGAFNIVPSTAAYLVDGIFDPERTMGIFSETVEQAVRDGFSGFRAAADMSWALSIPDGAEKTIVYEKLLKSMFATHRVTGLCLYRRNRTTDKLFDGALASHPIANFGGRYAENLLYEE